MRNTSDSERLFLRQGRSGYRDTHAIDSGLQVRQVHPALDVSREPRVTVAEDPLRDGSSFASGARVSRLPAMAGGSRYGRASIAGGSRPASAYQVAQSMAAGDSLSVTSGAPFGRAIRAVIAQLCATTGLAFPHDGEACEQAAALRRCRRPGLGVWVCEPACGSASAVQGHAADSVTSVARPLSSGCTLNALFVAPSHLTRRIGGTLMGNASSSAISERTGMPRPISRASATSANPMSRPGR